jgi:hypothetical protein
VLVVAVQVPSPRGDLTILMVTEPAKPPGSPIMAFPSGFTLASRIVVTLRIIMAKGVAIPVDVAFQTVFAIIIVMGCCRMRTHWQKSERAKRE